MQAQGDASRTAQVAQLALADWRIRRARATGNAQACADAQATLGSEAAETPSRDDLISALPVVSVTREPGQNAAPATRDPVEITVSEYALGYVDRVTAASPLPQYLALVYGGYLVLPQGAAVLDAETAANLVDQHAPEYPEWEPDALYTALRGGQR
jgi:hypothetical protein